jgi:thiosulfate dehydrogenase [quinone] large subunit
MQDLETPYGAMAAAEREESLDRRLAYLLLRLAIGSAMLMHGVVRVFVIGAGAFAGGMVRQMAHAPLPSVLVRLFGTVLPFGELILGLLLVLGLWTRWGLVAGVLLMLSLIFGSGLNSDWQGIGIQLTYAAIFCVLLGLRRYNALSLDGRLPREARSE